MGTTWASSRGERSAAVEPRRCGCLLHRSPRAELPPPHLTAWLAVKWHGDHSGALAYMEFPTALVADRVVPSSHPPFFARSALLRLASLKGLVIGELRPVPLPMAFVSVLASACVGPSHECNSDADH
jgi:hypothetical protein